MAREILFKAKRKDNGEWVKGYLLKDGLTGQYFIHAEGNSVNESDKVNEEGCLQFVAFEVDESTICQYTNLTDKNGNKIWENDVVKKHFYTNFEWFANSEEYTGKVEYEDCAWNIVFNKNGHKCVYPICMAVEHQDAEYFEVIGNIFDTELLGVASDE